MSSYQEYMVNIARSEKNWEAEFFNITYKEALELEKDKNIKEVSIYQKVGIAEEDFVPNEMKNLGFTKKMNLSIYNKEALKNSNIVLRTGRFPENSSEVIVSSTLQANHTVPKYPNEKLILTINGKTKEYTVVGVTEKLETDVFAMFYSEFGAITIFDSDNIEENANVRATILTKNISKIYRTVGNLAKLMNIEEKEPEEISESDQLFMIMQGIPLRGNYEERCVEYNTELLKYACVIEADTEFVRTLIITRNISNIYSDDCINCCNIYNI